MKLDQRILEIFDSLGDLTIFSWDMPDAEVVYYVDGEKNHVSMVHLDRYEHVSSAYPFDINIISIGEEQVFDRALECFERLKGKSRIFCILCEYITFYSLYRALGGMQNIDEIMAVSIREFGIFGKKIVQIVKDNESEEIAEKLLKRIPLANYLFRHSSGCLVTSDALYNEFMRSVSSLTGDTPSSIDGFFKLEDEIKSKLYSWLVVGRYKVAGDEEVHESFQFIMDGIIDFLMQEEYRDMLIEDVIGDIMRCTKEML